MIYGANIDTELCLATRRNVIMEQGGQSVALRILTPLLELPSKRTFSLDFSRFARVELKTEMAAVMDVPVMYLESTSAMLLVFQVIYLKIRANSFIGRYY